MQNGFIQRFNGSYRRGVLDMHVFRTLSEVREHTGQWLADYTKRFPVTASAGSRHGQSHEKAQTGGPPPKAAYSLTQKRGVVVEDCSHHSLMPKSL
jgi:hypothetical protein